MTTAKELRAYSKWAGRPPVLEIAADMLVQQAEEIERLKAERDDFHMRYRMKCDAETKSHAERIAQLEAARKTTTVHLIAAHSLLERGGKKAAASDKIFVIMLDDCAKAIEVGRAALNPTGEQP